MIEAETKNAGDFQIVVDAAMQIKIKSLTIGMSNDGRRFRLAMHYAHDTRGTLCKMRKIETKNMPQRIPTTKDLRQARCKKVKFLLKLFT